ncbi:hypothetical protein Alg130_08216 [Pyrenophora tritici-repentis]|uniref:Uncharacterized protein n=1 Tax=Pyrenophora tritici-repentis TaxID=45151 RepID=A0A5M9L707_9PLEO|nr:hypothetical protein PtrV1_08633 [Pyrenophora tritici-repentis]KAF7449675.1 hypothetical protein A1F99_067240 [Pyrenophora tritici-repentis]KAF7570204.1 hypothetical protein PtrM4_102060 [Pyrenophora tritici-repentis]KAI0574505.1 hypothetical protein Alg215_08560 [Pyrenophora tritici-repentis]KAI0577805.1 hypothetical protein Alg130_08216 [Pyrenophora tritici-repentis]
MKFTTLTALIASLLVAAVASEPVPHVWTCSNGAEFNGRPCCNFCQSNGQTIERNCDGKCCACI